MKVLVLYLAILLIVVTIVPYAIYNIFFLNNNVDNSIKISLYNHTNNKIQHIGLEEYIVGVVCAEMPAEFSDEALKAQAVAARTYTLRKLKDNSALHSDGDLCTDFSHCQAYKTTDDVLKEWGKNYNKYIAKIRNAVYSTKGEYMEYNNEPANSVFHACSNGMTENSYDVWGGDVPYLVSVISEGDKLNKEYISTVEFEKKDFIDKLNNFLGYVIDSNSTPVGEIVYTSGKNIKTIELFGEKVSGIDVRKIFSLKSTAFELSYNDTHFIFTVYGNGHGVGMSQYGSNIMAKNGYLYKDILQHYYPGTTIKNWIN